MRLGTCIALELVVAAGAVAGVAVGVTRASELAGTYLVAHTAEAATLPTVTAPRPLDPAHLHVEHARPQTVFGALDSELLAPIGASRVTRIKANHGGTSLSIRLDFASGARAAFKPEQIHPQSDPRREIAAYRIDRLLGIGRVPPAKSISLPVADLIAAADPAYQAFFAARFADEGIARSGSFRGEVSWWVPEIKLAKLGRHRIDEREGRDLWTKYLTVGAKAPPEMQAMLPQISMMILFDALIDNADRWSGSNTMMSPDGTILYFFDNTLAFSLNKIGHEHTVTALHRIQMFPRKLVRELRRLTYDSLTAAIGGDDPILGRLLHPAEIAAMLSRRDHILAYVDRLVAEHGEDAVLAF